MQGVAVMGREKYSVQLAQEERELLQQLIRGGKSPARQTARGSPAVIGAEDRWGLECSRGG